MASPVGDSYSCASGGVIAAGRAFQKIRNVLNTSNLSFAPSGAAGLPLVFDLHESQANPLGEGALYSGDLAGNLPYLTDTVYQWALVEKYGRLYCKPWDRQLPLLGGNVKQSYHCGWTHGPDSPQIMHLYTERRMDELYKWLDRNFSLHPTKRAITGGSMGAWGTMTYGIRRAHMFAALYPSRPRVRYAGASQGVFQLADWDLYQKTYTPAQTPMIDTQDGGGTAWAHQDIIGHVGNTANAIPWIGVVIGRNDGYTPFQDHIDFISALRSAKRGFAYAWNDGNHAGAPYTGTITDSYPIGLFEIGKGYPLFTNHSLDADPSVDVSGGINIGLTFRNVVETATSWSCDVTHISSACTVTVEPISKIFTATVTPKNITITGANSWVPVSFSV